MTHKKSYCLDQLNIFILQDLADIIPLPGPDLTIFAKYVALPHQLLPLGKISKILLSDKQIFKIIS